MIKKLSILLLFVVLANTVFSQGLTMYNMDMVPQASRTNPGLMPKANFHLGLPALSCLDVSLVNNGFVFSDVINFASLTPDKMLSKLQPDNYISLGLNIDLFSLGFKVKDKNYFSFNSTEKVAFNFDYSKDFMTFVTKGTVPFIGETMSMRGMGFRFTHYREYAVGYTRQWTDKLTAGVKVKLLQGMSNFNSEEMNIGLNTSADDFTLKATSTIGFRTSGLGFVTDPSSPFNAGKYLSNFENIGAAFDLGANYKFSKKLSASIAATDVGAIQWKTDATRYYNNKAEFTWSGLDIIKYLGDTNNAAYTKNLTDSLTNIFGLKKKENYTYSTSIIGNIYVGGKCDFNRYFNLGLLFHGQLFAGNLYPSYTAIGGINLGSMVQASVSYSVVNRSYNNVGAALALNLGPVQIYAAGDNVLGFSQLDYAKTLNVRVGVNIMTGYSNKLSKEQREQEKIKRTLSRKDSDKDGVNDFLDLCKDIAGPVEHKGCPDKDGDGVADNDDICPTEAGNPDLGGCPDGDNDGVADRIDECPTLYGGLRGCPDFDKDSIIDAEDLCPGAPGSPAMKGCPDMDRDGVSDISDKCVDVPGDIEHQGCPDSDGDGVYDNEDVCKNTPGTAEFKGCTDKDSDLDGVPDVFDKCPIHAGGADNGGCPLQ
jgi:hypothetical protein